MNNNDVYFTITTQEIKRNAFDQTKQCSTELYHTLEGSSVDMERNSDAIETIETITATETLNQDNIGNEDEAKSHLSNKGNNDGIMVKNNGNLNGLKPKENNKEEFCEVDLDEVSEHSLNVWF